MQNPVCTKLSTHLGKCPEMRLLGLNSTFSFVRNWENYFPQWLYHFAPFPEMNELLFLHTLSVPDLSHSKRWLYLIATLNSYLLMIYEVGHLFICLVPFAYLLR